MPLLQVLPPWQPVSISVVVPGLVLHVIKCRSVALMSPECVAMQVDMFSIASQAVS